jgi:peptide deformylase
MMLSIETGNKNKILRTISKKIPKSDIKKFIKLGKKMISYLKDTKNGGVGLAAPQI